MTIAVIQEFEGATLEQYDQVLSKMGFTPGGTGAPGGLFHWAAATDNGFQVVDVWESQEVFEKFAQETIGPLVAETGIAGPPTVTILPVHSYLTAG